MRGFCRDFVGTRRRRITPKGPESLRSAPKHADFSPSRGENALALRENGNAEGPTTYGPCGETL